MTETINRMLTALFFFLMAISSVWDIRKKAVPCILLVFSFLPGTVSIAVGPMQEKAAGMIMALLLGTVWGLFSRIRKNVGGADLILSAAAGMVFAVDTWLWGLFFAGLAAFPFALLIRRQKREGRLPFVPFLTVGFLCGKVCEVLICR